MTLHSPSQSRVHEETRDAPDPAVVQDVTAWVGQLVRTLKTCRLYDEANPTVVRFRDDLASSLATLLARWGALRLEVSSNTLTIAGGEVHVARSRDDNLAGVLHRDGIRLLTLEPGIDAREVEGLVDKILQVTGPSPGEEDLVTLLWDADLPHVVVETVPTEGEADGGSEDDAEKAPGVAWPKQEAAASALPATSAAEAASPPRSDDWSTEEHFVDLERAFDELESMALFEIARFQEEYDAGVGEDIVTEILRVLEDYCASDLIAADREALAEFIPRVLREALALGDWRSTSHTLRLLRTADPQWSVAEFSANLCGPFAITTRKVVGALDRQDQKDVDSFLSLAREFGPPLAEWLMHVLAESQQMRVRRPLARTIAELLADHPERVIPWLSDERWYVVRNAVHILGWIGGNGIAGHLRAAAGHVESRVRREVVAALSPVEHDGSRSILLKMLDDADPALFGTVLHQLAMDDHRLVTERLLELLRAGTFARRSEAERRALFLALATRGDGVLPALETELNEGGLFSRRPEPDRAGIALCIARIGTPAARAILEQGLRSKRGPVRKACLIAGASGGTSDD